MNDARRILIFTGDGKGKTTAALGMALRAHGHGMPSLVIQFVKSDTGTGEHAALSSMAPSGIISTGLGFVPRPSDPRFADHRRAAEAGLEVARKQVASGRYALVVLDEICTAVALGLLAEDAVLELLRGSSPGCHIVLTGRGATERLIEAADTVSEVRSVKHGYDSGRKAEKGVEY